MTNTSLLTFGMIIAVVYLLGLVCSAAAPIENFTTAVKHGTTITPRPPTLPMRPISWIDNFALRNSNLQRLRYTRDSTAAYMNQFPKLKPPAFKEHNVGSRKDLTRTQWIPRMASRNG
jgi:hypothetical protein